VNDKIVKATETTQSSSSAEIAERVMMHGDLSKLSQQERVAYYMATCKSLGLNPLTRPFDYISLNGKLTLYAKKDATDQLRRIYEISIDALEVSFQDELIIVNVRGHNKDGRTDAEVGVVKKSDMRGDIANAIMKASTKAKRRLTLSICGLGFLDETEVETIPGARVMPASEVAPIPYDQARQAVVKTKGGERFLGELTAEELQKVVENSKTPDLIEAAKVVLEHDFGFVEPPAN